MLARAGLIMVIFRSRMVSARDEFLRCTEPGLEQDRINVTSRWIWQRVASRPAVRTGVAFSLPACSQDSSAAVREFVGSLRFPDSECSAGSCADGVEGRRGGAGFAGVCPRVHRIWATQVCLSKDTPSGRRSAGALSSWPTGSS